MIKPIFDMNIEHEVDQRPFESCAHVAIGRPAAAGSFSCSFEIEKFKFFIEFDVIFERKIKLPFLSPTLDADVVFRIR